MSGSSASSSTVRRFGDAFLSCSTRHMPCSQSHPDAGAALGASYRAPHYWIAAFEGTSHIDTACASSGAIARARDY